MVCQYLFEYLRKNCRHYLNLFLFIIFPLSKFVLHSFIYFQIIWLCQLNYTSLNNQNILAPIRQLLWYSKMVLPKWVHWRTGCNIMIKAAKRLWLCYAQNETTEQLHLPLRDMLCLNEMHTFACISPVLAKGV